MDSFYQEIDQLAKIGYNSKQLDTCYKNHTIQETIQLLSQNKNAIVIDYVDALLRDQEYYKQIIFGENGHEFVQYLLQHQSKKVRSLLSTCLEIHTYEFGTMFKQLDQSTLQLILQVIFFQLSDDDSEVGLKALRMSKKLFKNFVNEEYVPYLAKGLNSKNEVVQLRYAELIIYLANQNQEQFNILQQLFERIFKLYYTDDILVKLNMIEILNYMGESEQCAKLLVKQKFFQDLLTQEEDFYVEKYQTLLLAKLLKQRVIQNKEKSLFIKIQKWLSGNLTEEIEAGLECVRYLASFSQGFTLITSNIDFLKLYFSYAFSTKDHLKNKFLSSFTGFLEPDQGKQPGRVAWIFGMLGQMNMSQEFDIERLQIASEYLLKLLDSPFHEVELLSLEILFHAICYEQILDILIQNQKLIPYLTKYTGKKEVFDMRKVIISQLIQRCEKSDKNKQYAQQLKNSSQIDMQYKSETL